MMKITGLSHLFKWENLHNWWLTKYFFAPLYIHAFFHQIKYLDLDSDNLINVLMECKICISFLQQFNLSFLY